MKSGISSWRLAVGTFLAYFGGLICVCACLPLILEGLVRLGLPGPLLFDGGRWVAVIAGHVLLFAAGILWWRAGRLILHQRGWWPLLYLAVGYVCGVSGGLLLENVRSSPWPD